jgi:hypothetical protein
MEKGDIYKTDNWNRQSGEYYVKILDIFKPWTYQYKWEKEKIWSEWKNIKSIFIKYERCDNPKFDFCYTNYMTRKDFLYNFNKYNLI